MREVVDVSANSEDGVAEVVDITVGSEDDVAEVPAGGPPLLFHGYRRGRELGRGASGQVFVCRRKGSATGFAVKAVNLQRVRLSSNAEREQKKLRREVDILKKLPPHKSIVQLVDAFEEGNWFLLVLELVGGGDLYTILIARAPPQLLEREAAFVLRQLADGLAFLHGQGVIHRDLKLENVLVASERKRKPFVFYTVKITDFGLSKAVGHGLSEARSTVGTRPYTAPEVLLEGLHGFGSDLWCLGVLLYVLLVGRFPFDRIATQQLELDRITEHFGGTEAAVSVVRGLLQLESSQRMSLDSLRCHEWLLQQDSSAEKPRKRLRSAGTAAEITSDMAVLSVDETAVQDVDGIDSAVIPMEVVAESPPTARVPDVIAQSPENLSPGESNTQLGIQIETSPCTVPKGAWTPFAIEATMRLQGVCPVSPQPDVMQVHVVIPDRIAGFVLGRNGGRIQQIAVSAGCRVWMTSREGNSDRHIVIIGNYKQCRVAQELVHEQMANAAQADDWRDTEAEILLLVRSEAAGVVIGKQGFVLKQIREQSGASIQLLREEVEGQRPCIIAGTLQSVLRAEKHVFDLVRAVPVALAPADGACVGGSLVSNTSSDESLLRPPASSSR